MHRPNSPLSSGGSRGFCASEETRVLLVEDKQSLREMLDEFLTGEGFAVSSAMTVSEGMELFGSRSFHVVLLDLRLPDGSGLDFLRQVRSLRPIQPVLVMTAYGTIEDSVAAMKSGAADFIQKPLDLRRLADGIRSAADSVRLQTEPLLYSDDFRRAWKLPLLISRHPDMDGLARRVQKIAPTDATVLLTGESGTGKELFARAIHILSSHRNGPFVELNCAAIPEALMENELFGHVRGAYTGAENTVHGKFEQASGGTLFLDEIGEVPLPIQPKLLRALEEKKVTPIGATSARSVDVRIVAATNREIEKDSQSGRFRADLYFRLAQFPLHIPPLRDRREDVPVLARHFVEDAAGRLGKSPPVIEQAVLQRLVDHPWPGNVRELKNLMERGVVVDDDGVLDALDLALAPDSSGRGSGDAPPEEAISRVGLDAYLNGRSLELEKEILLRYSRRTADRGELARELGVDAKSLAARWRKHFPESPAP